MTRTANQLLGVTLTTERLTLRPIRRDDAAFVVRHFTDPAVYQYLLDSEPITDEDAAAIVDFYLEAPAPTLNRWVLVRTDSDEPIGTCGYHGWSHQHHKAEIGYDLSPAAQGRGYMSEALAAALAHGFGAMGLRRVEALVAVANTRSLRLLERLGFEREGLLRDCFFSGGRFHDHLLYARLSPAPR